MKPSLVLVIVLVLALSFVSSGCATAPVRLENSARLIARPDFAAARAAAPEWCRDALKTINQLEHELERK